MSRAMALRRLIHGWLCTASRLRGRGAVLRETPATPSADFPRGIARRVVALVCGLALLAAGLAQAAPGNGNGTIPTLPPQAQNAGAASLHVQASLVQPADGAVVVAPATIELNATAQTDQADHPIALVEFYSGATRLGSVSSPPYAFTWREVPAGRYTLSVKAYNDKALASLAKGDTPKDSDSATSAPVTIVVNAPPTVNLTAPGANQIVTAPASIALTATASDSDGSIAQVEFFQGTSSIGTATAAPYGATWSAVPAGTYQLSAQATDDRGATTRTEPVTIIVNAPPTVNLTAPTANQIVTAPASIALTAAANDSDGTITQVEFFQGASSIGTATTAPYSATWSGVPAGTYQLTAQATDDRGATTRTAPVTVVVNAPPTVSLTAPTADQSFAAPASIALMAAASDSDGTIAQVEFFQGTSSIGTATTPPYSVTWSAVPVGTYQITAQATDNRGATTRTAPVTVKVVESEYTTGVFYILADHLNTPRIITDEQGQEVWRWDYDEPFGDRAPNEDPGQTGKRLVFNLRFPGQYFDRETGTSYNYFRDCYDPSTGRYCQSDPIGLQGGINTYTYVGGNPVSYVDPDGLNPLLGLGLRLLAMGLTAHGVAENPELGLAGGLGSAAKAGGQCAATETVNVQRWMSKAEFEATQTTGLLRGGRDGTHYVTDAANTNPLRARQRLALPQTPEVRVTIEVSKDALSAPSRVTPAFNMPGGGMERTAIGNVPVRIIGVD